MNTVVARIQRVLAGHSPTAMIVAVDENGHEHKLEVSIESIRRAAVGQILVLQWSIHGLPGALQENAAIEVVPVAEASTAAPARPTAVSGVIDSTATSTDGAAQLEELLGLRPGRLRGSGPSELP